MGLGSIISIMDGLGFGVGELWGIRAEGIYGLRV